MTLLDEPARTSPEKDPAEETSPGETPEKKPTRRKAVARKSGAAVKKVRKPAASGTGTGKTSSAKMPKKKAQRAKPAGEKSAPPQADEPKPGTGADEDAPPEEEGRPDEGRGKWYVVHSFSGHEQKVKRYLEAQVSERFPERVIKVLIPTEQITSSRGGRKTVREKKLYPGYVFARLDLCEEMVMEIRAMSSVSGFPPMNKGFPQPLTKQEVERILGQAEGREAPKSIRVPFGVGQTVRVISGPFNNFSGVVESINPERGRVRVIFTIFGRKAPVELDFSQVRIN
ncbi:transcription termination/antitermination factor NusG [Candidatus Fermentibacterales bacterium]|nr:transcription termination/antitermination factor NusG [Candidatus Fermentibacterales bacterium]